MYVHVFSTSVESSQVPGCAHLAGRQFSVGLSTFVRHGLSFVLAYLVNDVCKASSFGKWRWCHPSEQRAGMLSAHQETGLLFWGSTHHQVIWDHPCCPPGSRGEGEQMEIGWSPCLAVYSKALCLPPRCPVSFVHIPRTVTGWHVNS